MLPRLDSFAVLPLFLAVGMVSAQDVNNTGDALTNVDPASLAPEILPAYTPPKEPVEPPPPAPVNTGRISLSLGADWASEYIWRGYVIEDSGVIVQPWAEIGFALKQPGHEGDLAISAAIGVWNSLHSKHTGSNNSGADIWNEADAYGSLKFAWDDFKVGAIYTFYAYPNNDNANTVQEVGFNLGWNTPDDTWYGKWLGDPTVGVYIETENSNVGQDDASYFQLDFGPSFQVFDGKATLSIPATLGLSINDYYVGADDETFGYFSLGATLGIPLCSGDLGNWNLNVGGKCFLLGDTTEAVNNDDTIEVYGFVGVSMSY